MRSSSRVVQPLARLERGSRSNGSAIPRLFTNRTVGTPPAVVAANGACARKPPHPPSLAIEDSGIFNTRYRRIPATRRIQMTVGEGRKTTGLGWSNVTVANVASCARGRCIAGGLASPSLVRRLAYRHNSLLNSFHRQRIHEAGRSCVAWQRKRLRRQSFQ